MQVYLDEIIGACEEQEIWSPVIADSMLKPGSKARIYSVPDGDSEFRRFMRSFFMHAPGVTFGGADFGFAQDPSEISVKLLIGKMHRRVARLHLRHVKYDIQAEALDTMDDIFDAGQNKMIWGMDVGNAGSAVLHNLVGLPQYQNKDYEDRCSGFMFESAYESIDESGNLIIEPFAKVANVSQG